MVTKKKTKKIKKRKPKGKPLSQQLEERDARRAAEDEEEAAREGDDALDSSPAPEVPEFGADAGDERARDDDEDGPVDDDERPPDSEDDVPAPPPSAAESAPASEGGPDSEWEDEEDEAAAAQLGFQRYVIAGLIGSWMVGGYVLGRTLEAVWSKLAAKDWFVAQVPQLAAVPHEGPLVSRASISLVLGLVIAAGVVLRYYYKPEIRQWADEVAEQLTHVKWPARKEVGNNTVVVIVSTAVLTIYLTVLDRFWSFVTNLIYTSSSG
jgi:preprotein translocase subunit SecE